MSQRAYHEVRFPYNPSRAIVWRQLAGYLQKFVAAAEPILELGAGYGDFLRFVQAKDKFALDHSTALASHWPEEVRPLIQSALDPLPLDAASVGTVFASNFFEHFTQEEATRILAEVRRVLKPGGRLIVIQPNFRLEPRHYFDDYTHKTIYTDGGFRDFLRSLGWTIACHEGRFLPFSMNSRAPKAAWIVRLYLALPWRPLAGQFLIVAE